IAEAVVADVAPRSSWRAEKEFRLHLIRTLAQRVVACAVERAGGKIL
ncbi:TPA: xanthine dehydrogenase FAD-binding subunit XdhB, partial [Aeromonas hydrophila]